MVIKHKTDHIGYRCLNRDWDKVSKEAGKESGSESARVLRRVDQGYPVSFFQDNISFFLHHVLGHYTVSYLLCSA